MMWRAVDRWVSHLIQIPRWISGPFMIPQTISPLFIDWFFSGENGNHSVVNSWLSTLGLCMKFFHVFHPRVSFPCEVWMLGMALGSNGLQPVHTCCTCYFFYVTSPTQGKNSVSTSSASSGRIMSCHSGCTELLKLDSLETLLGIAIVAPQTAYNWCDAVWLMLKL